MTISLFRSTYIVMNAVRVHKSRRIGIRSTDKERKSFLSVQGRFSQKQFSTYFGEVKNHVLSQLFVEGIKGQKAEKKAREVLSEIFENGFITEEECVELTYSKLVPNKDWGQEYTV